MKSRIILCLCCVFSFLSCAKDFETLYAREHAFLRFTPVTAVSPLRNALNGTGLFCKISLGAKAYEFVSSLGKHAFFPYTAQDRYLHPLYVSGFIVGRPSLPDFSGQMELVAYDSVCPTCLRQDGIVVSVDLRTDETAGCSRCHRVYSLSNGGIVIKGEKGSKLLRYRIMYQKNQDLLLIQN